MSNILLFPKILATFRSNQSKQEEKEDGNENRTMSPKRWILLLVFYISYLMFGASIYYHIEHNLEKEQRAEDLKERIEINEYILDQLADKNVTTQNEVLEKITDYCGKPVTDYNNDEYEVPYTWTFYHSFFFAFTVCSTVGYGNISPTTTLGRMIMIVYSVIGIPVNGILFAGLGEYFSKTFQAIYRRYKKYKVSNDDHYVPPQLGLITIVAIALVPGITLFLLLPAWIFSYFEKWPYSLSFYYSYVTTTTIGFGDYVPTFGPNQPREFGGWFVVYQIFVIFWFVFSLGYLLMIMTFITRGLQSKKLAYLEQQLSTNIKATQNRIWNGVTKDVGYLRRILNELYILKFKPVYTEPDLSHLLYRSVSCPELSMYRVEPPPMPSRKRAFSECYDVIEARADGTPQPWVHAASDTELDKFDRTKSFETAEAFRQTTGLLAKVVTALATVKAPTDDDDTIGSAGMYGGGYHGLSDSQILASEWSFPGTNEMPPRRGRACSDFNINPKWQGRRPTSVQHNEWTWSGDNDQIQEAINKRHRQNDRENLYRSSFGVPSQDYIVNMEEDESKKPSRAKKFSIPDGFRKLFPFKKRPSEELIAGAEPVANGSRKFSVMSVPETQERSSLPSDYYNTVTANVSSSYAQNGKPLPTTARSLFPSESMQSRLNGNVNARRGSVFDSDQATLNSMATSTSYQRNAAAISRKRRESIFAQNPVQTARRASMFPTSSAAGLSQRRGSTFNTERRGSTASNAAIPQRRGSLYPASSRLPASNERRPSLFSVTSEQDLDVLENTTLADLIRALEVMHTQAVMDETASTSAGPSGGLSGIFKSDKKKRKVGSAGMEPPDLLPILSLFSGDNTKALSTTAANRLYARRATIVGTLPSTSFATNQASGGTSANVLTRRRPSSVQIVEPPPSYSEKEPKPTLPDKSSAVAKFKRRFSIRPTALQIPPGKAPPPGVNINSVLQQSGSSGAPPVASTASQSALASQTALQRRLSLRPSPLARELNTSSTQVGGSSSEVTATSPTGASSSNARLLPLPPGLAPRPSNTTSSTHSPLSRIAQITQAQRKSSMPDGFALERTKKPDGK